MKKALFFLLLCCFNSFSQDTIRTNPIFFAETFVGGGGSFSGYGGFMYGGTASFQHKKDFFTVRYIQHPEFKLRFAVAGTVGLPIIKSRFKNTEIAVMYGKRHIKNSVSYSYSGGISTNDFQTKYVDANNQVYRVVEQHLGFSYELNVKWFNSRKERYRIYMIVPVGKPIAFGRSFGFKLVGNISKHSYVGVGMTYGFGWHKNY